MPAHLAEEMLTKRNKERKGNEKGYWDGMSPAIAARVEQDNLVG